MNSIAKWYDNRIASGKRWRPRQCYVAFMRMLSGYKFRSLLDVGCGTGDFLSVLHEYWPDVALSGIDISPKSIEKALEYRSTAALYAGEMERLTNIVPGKFEAITCLGSLEHSQMNLSIKELYKIGTDNCVYLFVVPNSRFPFAGTDQQEINETTMTLIQWRGVFETSGFEIIKVLPDMSICQKYGIVKRLCSMALLSVLGLNCTYQFCFIMRKLRMPRQKIKEARQTKYNSAMPQGLKPHAGGTGTSA